MEILVGLSKWLGNLLVQKILPKSIAEPDSDVAGMLGAVVILTIFVVIVIAIGCMSN